MLAIKRAIFLNLIPHYFQWVEREFQLFVSVRDALIIGVIFPCLLDISFIFPNVMGMIINLGTYSAMNLVF